QKNPARKKMTGRAGRSGCEAPAERGGGSETHRGDGDTLPLPEGGGFWTPRTPLPIADASSRVVSKPQVVQTCSPSGPFGLRGGPHLPALKCEVYGPADNRGVQ